MTQQPQINPDGTQAEKPSMGDRAKDFLKAAITPNPKRKLDYLKENPDVVMAAVTRNPRYLMENGGNVEEQIQANIRERDSILELVDELNKKHKRKYANVDIESPKSEEEKESEAEIRKLLSEATKLNDINRKLRQTLKMAKGGNLEKLTTMYTTAPENYDGFGTETVDYTDYYDSKGRQFRKVFVPEKNISWQSNRYSSGMMPFYYENDFIEMNEINPNYLEYRTGGKKFDRNKRKIEDIEFISDKGDLASTTRGELLFAAYIAHTGNEPENMSANQLIDYLMDNGIAKVYLNKNGEEWSVSKLESYDGDAISTFANETLPNQKIWDDMVNSINTEDSYTDISKLELGDVVLMRDGGLGFVTKINPKTIKVLKYMQKGVMGKIDPELYEVMVEKDLIDVFKKPKKNADAMLQNDVKISSLVVSTKLEDYKNPYEINRAIEKLIDERGEDQDKYTPEEINFIGYYSGYGGLEKYGSFSDEELKGLLYEFFTPDEVVKKMWGLAYKYGYGTIGDNSVFEPSVGIGAFLKYAPSDAVVEANEINRYSATICKILYPHARVSLMPFETNFIKRNESVKGNIESIKKYSLVIGNPPYGKLLSKYIAMGEDKYTKAQTFTEYFIFRGLDLLQSGGLLIYVVGAQQYNGGTLFLDSDVTKAKLGIFDKAELIDAYRLPINIFERTGVSSEILIFKKR